MLVGFSLDNPGQMWLLLVIGLAAAGAALFVGRLFLIQPPSPGTMAALPAPVAGDIPERRRSPRLAVGTLAILLADPDDPQQVHTGTLIDRSLGGLGIELAQEVVVGAHFQVRLEEAAPETPSILVAVRYCRRRGDRRRAGCQFVDASSWDVMNLFGPPEPEE